MKSFPQFLAAFVNAAGVIGVLYLNLNFSPIFFVPSKNSSKNLIHLMEIVHKFSTFPLNLGVMEGHWHCNEEILSP